MDEHYTKRLFVSGLSGMKGSACDYFIITKLQTRTGRLGQKYLVMTLSDKTGFIEARMWENCNTEDVTKCKEGNCVRVEFTVDSSSYGTQLKIVRMRLTEPKDTINVSDFVPTTKFDIAEMNAELRGYVAAFKSEPLRALVLAFLDDPDVGSKFTEAPAAKRLHHAWIGGLLEHVLYLVRVCVAVAPFYPEVDPDLLVTGAILHDIGKVRELSWRSSFDYTLEGQLVGHISIAQGMLQQKVAALRAAGVEFPEKLRVLVEHMILAHHGKLEFGSPKLPMTPEAMLLSALDDLEAKFQTLRNEFAAARSEGRAAGAVTDWVRSMERPLFDSRGWLEEKTTDSGE